MNIYTWFYVLYSNTYTVSCGVGATLILNYARETSYLALKGKCFFLYPSIKIKFLFEGMQWRKMSKNPIPGHDTVSLQFQLWSRHRTKLEKRKMKKIWRFLKFMLPCSKWDLFNTLYIKHTIMFLKGFTIQHPCFTETLPFSPHHHHIIYHSPVAVAVAVAEPTHKSVIIWSAGNIFVVSLVCLSRCSQGSWAERCFGGVPVYLGTWVPGYMGTWLSGAM